MCIDTTTAKIWKPYCALAITGVWVMLVALIVFALGSGCGGGSPPPPATGSLSLAWSITHPDGHAVTCADVNARSVALRLLPRAGGDVIATALPCTASPGTAQVAPGVYDVTIELHAANGAKLATAPLQTGVAIVAGRVKTLTPVTFSADPKGILVVSIATPRATNCGSTMTGGAGITGTVLTLGFAVGGCAPVTFTRMLGNTPRGTYDVRCSEPRIATCVENNETLTTSLAPGDYIIRVRGKLGAADCWQRDDTLTVLGPGQPVTHAVGLVHVNVPGC
jgi:hypothetical protein